MANPQIEKGFLRIASGKPENDILIALIKANLTATQYQIMMIVIRKTWGWNKKEDWISISQFVELTTKSRKQIIEDIKSLVKRNILVKSTILGKTSLLRPNKIFSEWLSLVKSTTLVKSSRQTSVVQPTQLVKPTTPTIDIITKDNIQKTLSRDNTYGDDSVNYIINSYKKRMGFLPTDRRPRFVAQNIVQNINRFIKDASPYKPYTFEGIVDRSFEWYMERDQLKGETLDVVRRKFKKLFELTLNKLKGGELK